MSNALIDVLDFLARKAPLDGFMLVEVFALDKASQLCILENLLDLAERKFDGVVLR